MQLSYKDAVDYLVQHPECIWSAWSSPRLHVAGRLFLMCFRGEGYLESHTGSPISCGCLTMISRDQFNCKAFNKDRTENELITEAIRRDQQLLDLHDLERLRGDELRVALERYAEWQGVLDVELTHGAAAEAVTP